MNEFFDKLILRIIFAFYICAILFFYKYAHAFLYPSSRQQLFRRFFPSKNLSDTLHLFSRIIGLGIIFSNFEFILNDGFLIALFDFLLYATVALFLYLISIYLIESIVLFNFEYLDEVIKRKNATYALISFSHAIGVAYLIKVTLSVAGQSLTMLIFLWLFAIVILGLATKTFSLVSKLHFNRLIIQKNLGLAFSYMGFFWGWTIIIGSSLDHALLEIRWYAIHVILKIILAMIIIPIFLKGIGTIFNIQEDPTGETTNEQGKIQDDRLIGHGVYEGGVFFTSCFLTRVITEQIMFGTFYPVF